MDKQTLLRSFGLSGAEIEIYLLLLQIGESKAGPIIKQASVSSSNVHEALERLAHKGLVTSIRKNSVKHYRPSPADHLKILVEQEKRKIREQEEGIQLVIKELQSTEQTVSPDQDVEMFFGEEGMKSAHKKLLANKTPDGDFCFFHGVNTATDELSQAFFARMDKEDYYHDVPIRAIAKVEQKRKFQERKVPFQIRYTKSIIPSLVSIYQNKILILSWTPTPMCVLITSQEIMNTFRVYFNAMWDQLEDAK